MEINNIMNQFKDWKSNRKLAITKLYEVAKALDAVEYNMHMAKIAGKATSIVFGIGSAAAGIVSFFTLGAAVPVAIGLGVAAGTGGVAATGSVIYKFFKEKTKLKDVQKILDRDVELTKSVNMALQRDILPEITAVMGAFGTTSDVASIGGPITGLAKNVNTAWQRDKLLGIALSLSNKLNAIVKLTEKNGEEVLRNAGNDAVMGAFGTTRDVTSIAGPIIGLATVPFEVYTLVKSAIAVDKKTPSAVAEDLRKRAREMQKELDAIEERERF